MPIMGNLPVQAIDVALVDKVLSPIWQVKTETASRVRGRIESVLDWATTRGHRQGENPARWRGHLENLFPTRATVRLVKHHAALPFAELPAFMIALQNVDVRRVARDAIHDSNGGQNRGSDRRVVAGDRSRQGGVDRAGVADEGETGTSDSALQSRA